MSAQLSCRCVRPSTGSWITVRIPPGVTGYAITDWIGGTYKWQFVPMSFDYVS